MNDSHSARFASQNEFGPLATHGRFPYRPITDSDGFRWPDGSGLAVYLGFNIEHFAFGEGLGARSVPSRRNPTCSTTAGANTAIASASGAASSCSTRSTCRAGALINTALYDHCPEVVDARASRAATN